MKNTAFTEIPAMLFRMWTLFLTVVLLYITYTVVNAPSGEMFIAASRAEVMYEYVLASFAVLVVGCVVIDFAVRRTETKN